MNTTTTENFRVTALREIAHDNGWSVKLVSEAPFIIEVIRGDGLVISGRSTGVGRYEAEMHNREIYLPRGGNRLNMEITRAVKHVNIRRFAWDGKSVFDRAAFFAAVSEYVSSNPAT